MSVLLRLGLTLAVACGATVAAAIFLALVDLYLTGHGYDSIRSELVSRPAWGVHLSLGDLLLLAVAVLAACLTWWSLSLRASPGGSPPLS